MQRYYNYLDMAEKSKKNEKKISFCKQLHKLRYYKMVQDLTKQYYEPGEDVLVRVFYKRIYPLYPMSYSQFRRILEEPQLRKRIEELENENIKN